MMNNLKSTFSRLCGAVALGTLVCVASVATAGVIWQVGMDDDGWPEGDGGGPNTTFVQETGTNPLPGSPNNPEVNQQGDDDYYFAGTYTTVLDGSDYVPLGVVAVNEEGAERAFAGSDNFLRYHFNLPDSIGMNDPLTVTFDANNLHGQGGTERYGVEVWFNGVQVGDEVLVNPATLDFDFTTPSFTLADVNGATGPGPDNYVELRGISYSDDGGGAWMGVDYVQLEVVPEPSSVVLMLSALGALGLLGATRLRK